MTNRPDHSDSGKDDPIFGPNTGGGRCCWPGCVRARDGKLHPHDRTLDLELCRTHALHVYFSIRDDFDAAGRRRRTSFDHNGISVEHTPQRDRPANDHPGIVYYVRVGDRIKVGWTRDLQQRLRAYPPGAAVLAYRSGSKDDERDTHRLLVTYRVDGREWYGMFDGMMNHIADVVAEHGAPFTPPVVRRQRARPNGQPIQLRARNGRR